MIKLTDICTPKQWKTLSSSDLLKSGYPVYGANGIIGYWNVYNHKEPTVLITCRGATCGSVNLSKPFSYINGNAMCLDNVSDNYDVKFLFHYLSWYDFSNIITGSAQPQITRQSLSKVYIPLIDKKKQQNIVHDLTVIERALINRQQALSILNHLVKSRFVEMFGTGEFPSVKLKDVCSKITDGTHKTPVYLSEGIPFVSAKNIKDGKLVFDDIKYISEQECAEIQKRCQITAGDILLTKSGSLGMPALVDVDFPFGVFESLAVLKYDRERLNGAFLHSQINSDDFQHRLLSGVKGIAVKHLHLNVIGATEIILPPMELQNQFADFVALTDKSKLAVQQSIDTLQTLKAKLMQDYFG